MRIHQFIEKTRANGPGVRFCIWVQGCSLRCLGCFNPETHDFGAGFEISVADIFEMIKRNSKELEGVSISGGEPFDQAEDVLELILRIKKELNLSVILWTGYELHELMNFKTFSSFTEYLDLIITGRYMQSFHNPKELKGSSNQQYIFVSDKYSENDLKDISFAEIQLGEKEIKITGVGSEIVKGWFK